MNKVRGEPGNSAVLLLHLLPVGDIEPGADQFIDTRRLIADQAQFIAHPAVFTVLSLKTIFVDKMTTFKKSIKAGQDPVPIFGMDMTFPEAGVTEELVRRISKIVNDILANESRPEIIRLPCRCR